VPKLDLVPGGVWPLPVNTAGALVEIE